MSRVYKQVYRNIRRKWTIALSLYYIFSKRDGYDILIGKCDRRGAGRVGRRAPFGGWKGSYMRAGNRIDRQAVWTLGGVELEILWKTNMKNIHVRACPPEGRVRVTAPVGVSEGELQAFLLERLGAIENLRQKARTRQEAPAFGPGVPCYIWGKPYRLEVFETAGEIRAVRVGDALRMYVPRGAGSELLERVYAELCRQELQRAYPAVARACEARTGLHPTEYRLKNMKTRWGTCNVKARRVWLSTKLAQKPRECLEYVLIHELTHLVEKDHNARFYALVEKYCPTWREAERLLNGKVAGPRP